MTQPFLQWSYPSGYMPPDFHQAGAFTTFIKWLDQRPYIGEGDAVASMDVVYRVLLPIGMLLRDLWHVQFNDPDVADATTPSFVLNSALTFQDCQLLLEYCMTITAAARSLTIMYVFKCTFIHHSITEARPFTEYLILQDDLDGHLSNEFFRMLRKYTLFVLQIYLIYSLQSVIHHESVQGRQLDHQIGMNDGLVFSYIYGVDMSIVRRLDLPVSLKGNCCARFHPLPSRVSLQEVMADRPKRAVRNVGPLINTNWYISC